MKAEEYMTVEEAAEYTKNKLPDRPDGFSPDAVRRAVRKGFIKGADRFGKRSWKVPKRGVDNWLASEIDHKPGPKSK